MMIIAVPVSSVNRLSGVNKQGLVGQTSLPGSVEPDCLVFLFYWLGGMFKLHRVAQPDG